MVAHKNGTPHTDLVWVSENCQFEVYKLCFVRIAYSKTLIGLGHKTINLNLSFYFFLLLLFYGDRLVVRHTTWLFFFITIVFDMYVHFHGYCMKKGTFVKCNIKLIYFHSISFLFPYNSLSNSSRISSDSFFFLLLKYIYLVISSCPVVLYSPHKQIYGPVYNLMDDVVEEMLAPDMCGTLVTFYVFVCLCVCKRWRRRRNIKHKKKEKKKDVEPL